MPALTLKAHYDGRSIQLDEPYKLAPNARLLVTVLEPVSEDREGWTSVSAEALARAFGEDEPEYGADDLRRP